MKWPSPMACSCPGHRRPGVMHARACCDEPHITQEEWDAWHPVREEEQPDGATRG